MTLTPDQQNTIEDAFSAAQNARTVFGGAQDLKIIEECSELVQALARRVGQYKHGGKRGDVDDELADAFLTIVGAMPEDSPVWDRLRFKTGRLMGIVEEARHPNPVSCIHVEGEAENV